MPKSRVQLKDVAEKANVSAGAVSLILRDAGRFSDETRARVKSVAAACGYEPDPLFSSLAARRSRQVEERYRLPVAELRTTPRSDRNRIVHELARRFGFELEDWQLQDWPNSRRLGDVLHARGVRGIIIDQLYGYHELPDIGWERFAVVCNGRPYFPVRFPIVRERILEAISETWQECRRRGYRRIGFDLLQLKSWREDHPDDRARLAAVEYCLRHTPKKERVRPHFGMPMEMEAYPEWLEKEAPDVIITQLAYRVQQLRASGIRVPEDVAVVSMIINRPDSDVTGWFTGGEERSLEVFKQLEQSIRHNCFGPLKTPTEILVQLPWWENKTFPAQHENR